MTQSILVVFRVLAVAASALVLTSCGKTQAPPTLDRAVKVMTVGQDSSDSALSYSGEIRARVESALGFRVAGKLVARHVDLGQRVKAGQVLADIDSQDYALSAQAAQAQLVAAQTNRDLSASDFKRYKDLFDQGFISGAELERREAAFKAAQAQWEQAKAQRDVQTNQAGYTRLVADAPGVITSVDASVGQVLAVGQPVVHLAQDGARDVVFSVPEQQLNHLKTGMKLDISLWQSEQKAQAQIRDIAASADPVTRTFTVKAVLLNALQANQADTVLGATANVWMPANVESQQRLVVPTSALRSDAKGTSVWLFDAATLTVKPQAVEVKGVEGNQVVIASGLKAGDQIVTTGVHVLTDGQKVSLFKSRP